MKRIKLSRLSDRQLRRLISRAEVRFGDWRDEERKKYYSEIEKAFADYYDDVQWYMNGNGFSGLKANVQRLQKYNPKMAKSCEKLMKDFDERRKKLLAMTKSYIDEVKKRIRERG